MRIWAVVTARAGSKRVKDKNLRLVGGRPLVLWTLEAAVLSDVFERILVSSDSEAIRELSASAGVPPLPPRQSDLASDTATSHSVVTTILEAEESAGLRLPDAICLLQPTSPFRRAQHIRAAVDLFAACPEADSLVSCQEVSAQWLPRYQAVRGDDGFLVSASGGAVSYPSQSPSVPHWARNGGIYLTRVPQVFDYLVGGRVLPYVMDERASIDINTEFDLAIADLLALSQHEREL